MYPNPNDGENLYLEIEKPELGKCRIDILSQAGSLIKTLNLTVNEESRTIQFELLEGIELSSGVYNVKVTSTNNTRILQFIVR